MTLTIDKTRLPRRITANDLIPMEVGDSAFVPAKDEKRKQRIRSAASYNGKRDKRKYICRSWIDHGLKGIRIWRVE